MEPQTSPLICPAHTTQYIGAVIIGILVGAGASFVYFKQAPVDSSNTYQAGFDAAKNLVLKSPMGMIFRTPDDIRTLSGTVTAINGNKITIHIQSTNPFNDPASANRVVVISADTKIIKLTLKDPKVMQVEMEAFMKKMQSGKGALQVNAPPESFTRTSATIADIVVGSTISVIALENIKTMKEFSASEITIQPKLITN